MEGCIQTRVHLISEIEVSGGLRVCVFEMEGSRIGQYGEGPAPSLVPLGASIDPPPHPRMNEQSIPERLQMPRLLTGRICNKGHARRMLFADNGVSN